MNILFIAYNFSSSSGGVQRVTDIIARGLKNRGHNVYFLCACSCSIETSSQASSKTVYYIDGNPNEALSQAQICEYKHFLQSNQINIIVNQYPLHKRGDILFKNTPSSIKKIAFYHGKPFGLLNAQRRFQMNPKHFFLYILQRYKLRNRFKAIIQSSDILCLLCKGNIDELKKEVSVDDSKIAILNNPNTFISSARFLPENKQNIVLFVGRVSDKVKNVFDFIKVWELIYNKNPKWRALIVGDNKGCEEYEQYIDRRNIKNIEFAGYQSDIKQYYDIAKIICITSHSEGWPMIINEAKSTGCVPCSYSTYGAVYELINHLKSGVIVDSYDVKQMANSVNELMNNSDLLHKLAKTAIEETLNFREEIVINQYETLFNQICKR